MWETVRPSACATSKNLGIGGKPGRFILGCGSFAEGGSGTAVLCARRARGNMEPRTRKTKKIARAESREWWSSIRIILAQRIFWPKLSILTQAGGVEGAAERLLLPGHAAEPSGTCACYTRPTI